ncbi:MAG: terminase small subunit [Candidatus Edwardsbacteria bacterium]
MKQRKIDDSQLLEMFRQGKMQKEIADYFGCSPVAVCKRLKRLLPPVESVLDKYDFTEKQKKFVLEKARGKTATQAVIASYEVSSMHSAKVMGSHLMAKPEIQMALKELIDYHLPQHYRIRKLRTHVDNVDPAISLKALDMSWKLDGSYAPEKHLVANINYADLCKKKEELKRAIAEYKAQYPEETTEEEEKVED